MDAEDFISFILLDCSVFRTAIYINKNSTITELIFLISKTIEKNTELSKKKYYFYHQGKKLGFDSRTLSSSNLREGDIIRLIPIDDNDDENNNKNLKEKKRIKRFNFN